MSEGVKIVLTETDSRRSPNQLSRSSVKQRRYAGKIKKRPSVSSRKSLNSTSSTHSNTRAEGDAIDGGNDPHLSDDDEIEVIERSGSLCGNSSSPGATALYSTSPAHHLSQQSTTSIKFANSNRLSLSGGSTLQPCSRLTPSPTFLSSTTHPPNLPRVSQDCNRHSEVTEPDGGEKCKMWKVEPSLQKSRDNLCLTLRYYFMSPIEKWNHRSRFPWKLVLQLLKIILVTTQAINIGHKFSRFQQIDHPIVMAMHNYFFLDWDSSNEYNSVPPVSGPYAVYTKAGVFSHLDYAVRNFANISALSAGFFGYQQQQQQQQQTSTSSPMVAPIDFCFQRFANASFDPGSNTFDLDPTIIDRCYRLENFEPAGAPEWANFSSVDFLRHNHSLEVDFAWLLRLTLKLPLRGIILSEQLVPACFDFDVWIHFGNNFHLGQIAVTLTHYTRQLRCNGNTKGTTYHESSYAFTLVINILSLLVCLVSIVLCLRSIYRSFCLCRRTRRFFARAYKQELDLSSQTHFIDGWIFMTVFNDFIIIAGTIFTMVNENEMLKQIMNGDKGHEINSLRPPDFDHVGTALLGSSAMLVWFSALRYLAYFSNYNILIVTFKHSLPSLFRFLLCALIIFNGFSFGGWIILGPILFKFASLAGTAECLFALMNGDDVFATFAYLHKTNFWIWIFSRFYLYTFVLLFIYVILSIFIAILTDSYEQVKHYYKDGKHRHIKEFFGDNGLLARFMFDNIPPTEELQQILQSNHDWSGENDADGSFLAALCRSLFGWVRRRFAGLRWCFARRTVEDHVEAANLIASQPIN